MIAALTRSPTFARWRQCAAAHHEHSVPEDAGIVHEDVKVTVGSNRLFDQSPGALPIGDIVGVGSRLTPGRRLYFGDNLLRRCDVVTRAVDIGAQIAYDDLRAICREKQCVCTPQPTTGPRDDGDPALECSHAPPSSFTELQLQYF
jgi:hypothetical protein